MKKRYHKIELVPDDGVPGSYRLVFSLMPGMSNSITELKLGDIAKLAELLDTEFPREP